MFVAGVDYLKIYIYIYGYSFRDAWKAKEGTSQTDAKEQYIEALLSMFDDIGTKINVTEWVNGPDLDPSVKQNLILLGKVF